MKKKNLSISTAFILPWMDFTASQRGLLDQMNMSRIFSGFIVFWHNYNFARFDGLWHWCVQTSWYALKKSRTECRWAENTVDRKYLRKINWLAASMDKENSVVVGWTWDIGKYLMFFVSTHHFLEHHWRIRYNRTKNGTVPKRRHTFSINLSAETETHLTTYLIAHLFLSLKFQINVFKT